MKEVVSSQPSVTWRKSTNQKIGICAGYEIWIIMTFILSIPLLQMGKLMAHNKTEQNTVIRCEQLLKFMQKPHHVTSFKSSFSNQFWFCATFYSQINLSENGVALNIIIIFSYLSTLCNSRKYPYNVPPSWKGFFLRPSHTSLEIPIRLHTFL